MIYKDIAFVFTEFQFLVTILVNFLTQMKGFFSLASQPFIRWYLLIDQITGAGIQSLVQISEKCTQENVNQPY